MSETQIRRTELNSKGGGRNPRAEASHRFGRARDGVSRAVREARTAAGRTTLLSAGAFDQVWGVRSAQQGTWGPQGIVGEAVAVSNTARIRRGSSGQQNRSLADRALPIADWLAALWDARKLTGTVSQQSVTRTHSAMDFRNIVIQIDSQCAPGL